MAVKCNLVSVLGALLLLTIIHNPTSIVADVLVSDIALFTFGDSSYDAGNKVFLSTKKLLPQTFWPYGKSRDYPNGKFSDGYIVPDFIAEFISIPNGIPPVLKPDVDLSRGASFAVADATVLNSPVESMTLNNQVAKFRTMRLKKIWTDEYITKSLFMVYIGTGDYLNFTKYEPDADKPEKAEAFVTKVINQVKNDIGLLYGWNATKFVVQLLPPLGCLPHVKQLYNIDSDKCYEPLNELAKAHNKKLGLLFNELAKSPNSPGLQFTIFDFYSAILRRTQPQRSINYRFFETSKACCGIGLYNAYGCGMGNVHSKLCNYQRSYLFFDGLHNTEKAQEQMAHLIFGANTNVIQPMTARELIVFPVGMNMLEFWNPADLGSVKKRIRRPFGRSYIGSLSS